MKLTGILLTTAAAIALSGCSTLVSLQPFVTDQQAVFDAGLLGIWANSAQDELFIVRQDGKNYKIRHIKDQETQSFSAQLFKIGDLRILDLVSDTADPFQVAVHTPTRVWVDGSSLRFAMLDSDWLKENARKQLAIQDSGDRALITAPGDAVLKFLVTYGAGDNAYRKPSELQKQQQ